MKLIYIHPLVVFENQTNENKLKTTTQKTELYFSMAEKLGMWLTVSKKIGIEN